MFGKSTLRLVIAVCALTLVAGCAAPSPRSEGAVSGSSQSSTAWWPSGPNPDSAYGPVNMNIAH